MSRFAALVHRAIGATAIGLAILVAAAPAIADHPKTDVVTTDDGNTWIGELKSVVQATVTLKTDAGGTINIEWRRVTSVTSEFEYRVEVTGGIRYFGSLGKADKAGTLSIVSPSGTLEVNLADVVAISPVASNFWSSLDGSVNFGSSYTQSSDLLQYNFSANVTRRVRTSYTLINGQSIFNTQEGAEDTSQHHLQFALSQLGKGRWGLFELGELQSNPAQGYDLRILAGGGVTNFFIEDSWRLLALNIGVVYNRENVTNDPTTDSSAEALVSVTFQRFKRSSHSPSIQFSAATFTNITGESRFRSSASFNINWKIVGDFNFGVQLSNNYDSNPPGEDSQSNDISIVTSLGYTF